MACDQSSHMREYSSGKSLFQVNRMSANEQQTSTKKEQIKLKVHMREEMIEITAEINVTEINKIIQKNQWI